MALACGPSVSLDDVASGTDTETTGVGEPPEVSIADPCGTGGLVRIVPLSVNETVDLVIAHGEGFLVKVTQWDARYDYDEWPSPEVLAQMIIRVDACGEDRRVIVDGPAHIYRPDREGQPWLAQGHDAHLMWFDPTGHHGPRVVEGAESSDHARVGSEILLRADGRLLRVAFAEDGAQTVVDLGEIGDDWRTSPRPSDPEQSVVLTLRPETGELVEIDPMSGTEHVLRTEVDTFEVSLDGRALLWWPRGEYNQDPPPHPRLWDRRTGEEIEIGMGLYLFGVHLAPGAVAAISWAPITTEITFLDTLERVRIDDAYTVRTVGANGTLLLQAGKLPGYGELHTLAPHDTSPILRGARGVQERYVWADDEAFWAVEQTDGSAPNLGRPPEPGVHANVVRFPYDTATAEVVAPNLWEPVSLSGGHWVGARNLDEDAIGELWLRTAGGSEMLVDDDVFAWVNWYNQRPIFGRLPTHPARLDDRWVYMVMDESGERRGLWLAQIESR